MLTLIFWCWYCLSNTLHISSPCTLGMVNIFLNHKWFDRSQSVKLMLNNDSVTYWSLPFLGNGFRACVINYTTLFYVDMIIYQCCNLDTAFLMWKRYPWRTCKQWWQMGTKPFCEPMMIKCLKICTSLEATRSQTITFYASVWPRLMHQILSHNKTMAEHVNRLMQKRHNSIANALELRFSCTNPSMYRAAVAQSMSKTTATYPVIFGDIMKWWHSRCAIVIRTTEVYLPF